MIDIDGYVHRHLYTEMKTVSSQAFEILNEILAELKISSNTKMRDAPSNSFSTMPHYEIYFHSSEVRLLANKILSGKISRYLIPTRLSEKD